MVGIFRDYAAAYQGVLRNEQSGIYRLALRSVKSEKTGVSRRGAKKAESPRRAGEPEKRKHQMEVKSVVIRNVKQNRSKGISASLVLLSPVIVIGGGAVIAALLKVLL